MLEGMGIGYLVLDQYKISPPTYAYPSLCSLIELYSRISLVTRRHSRGSLEMHTIPQNFTFDVTVSIILLPAIIIGYGIMPIISFPFNLPATFYQPFVGFWLFIAVFVAIPNSINLPS
jgi:hypothetical protein